jgi:hypothetical protein
MNPFKSRLSSYSLTPGGLRDVNGRFCIHVAWIEQSKIAINVGNAVLGRTKLSDWKWDTLFVEKIKEKFEMGVQNKGSLIRPQAVPQNLRRTH